MKMANISPVTQALNSIAQCLAAASEAARKLDLAQSQHLRSLLQIAGCEAERVRKASRKASKKSVAKIVKSSAKSSSKTIRAAKPALQQAKGRRKAAMANGAAAAL
jgi:hypothetical protein